MKDYVPDLSQGVTHLPSWFLSKINFVAKMCERQVELTEVEISCFLSWAETYLWSNNNLQPSTLSWLFYVERIMFPLRENTLGYSSHAEEVKGFTLQN